MSKLLATLVVALGMSATAHALGILHNPPGGPTAAPEIDPAEALGALTLLAGGLAVIRARYRKK